IRMAQADGQRRRRIDFISNSPEPPLLSEEEEEEEEDQICRYGQTCKSHISENGCIVTTELFL
ncbi:hypothetical protein HID58_071217, partial [Brassica napus]